MAFKVKEALINSCFMSNISYCTLVWMFSSAKSLNRMKQNLQKKKALRFLLDNYKCTFEQLLNKAGRSSMSINRLRTFMQRNLQDFK